MTEQRSPGAGIRERFPEVEVAPTPGMDTLLVSRDDLLELLTHLRDAEGFDLLSDVTAVDWLPRDPRFDVNYQLTRTEDAARVRVKVGIGDDDPSVPSATGVYPAANWHECEVYDLFGVDFPGHPELRRIFMPPEWIGHPLRKDYAVGGVPVEYKIEPAYVGERVVSEQARPAAGGVPGRLARDRGEKSRWTWTGPPATGIQIRRATRQPEREEGPGSDGPGSDERDEA